MRVRLTTCDGEGWQCQGRGSALATLPGESGLVLLSAASSSTDERQAFCESLRNEQPGGSVPGRGQAWRS